MRFTLVLFALLPVTGQTPATAVWSDLTAKREKLASLHQEFEVKQTSKTSVDTQASTRMVLLDMSGKRWRETSRSGSGDFIRIFDGKDLFSMDGDGNEYVRAKRKAKEEDPLPAAYGLGDPDWPKAVEVQRKPCGFQTNDRSCIVLEAPVRRTAAA